MCAKEQAVVTYYRIYDRTDNETLADKIADAVQAQEVFTLLKLQYPKNELEIESYSVSSVKPGFGRDPDLH